MIAETKIPWGKIFLFYIIAFTISGLFNSGFLTSQYVSLTEGLIIKNWPFITAGIGTLIATFLAFVFDRKTIRTITLLGNYTLKNLLISIAPALVFTAIGIFNVGGHNEHYYAFVFALVALFYALSEEIFWRGYLLDALKPLNKIMYSLLNWHHVVGMALQILYKF